MRKIAALAVAGTLGIAAFGTATAPANAQGFGFGFGFGPDAYLGLGLGGPFFSPYADDGYYPYAYNGYYALRGYFAPRYPGPIFVPNVWGGVAPGVDYPRDVYQGRDAHGEWCSRRYRTYNLETNTYFIRRGVPAVCRSPYS